MADNITLNLLSRRLPERVQRLATGAFGAAFKVVFYDVAFVELHPTVKGRAVTVKLKD